MRHMHSSLIDDSLLDAEDVEYRPPSFPASSTINIHLPSEDTEQAVRRPTLDPRSDPNNEHFADAQTLGPIIQRRLAQVSFSEWIAAGT